MSVYRYLKKSKLEQVGGNQLFGCMHLLLSRFNLSHSNIIQCPPLNRNTLGQLKSDNKNRLIQLTDVFWVLFRWDQQFMNMIYDSIILLSGGHSNNLNVPYCALFCFCAADNQKLRATVLDSIQLICYACIWVCQ